MLNIVKWYDIYSGPVFQVTFGKTITLKNYGNVLEDMQGNFHVQVDNNVPLTRLHFILELLNKSSNANKHSFKCIDGY